MRSERAGLCLADASESKGRGVVVRRWLVRRGPWVGVVLGIGLGSLIVFAPDPGVAWRLAGLTVGVALAIGLVGWGNQGGRARAPRQSVERGSREPRALWWRAWLRRRAPVLLSTVVLCAILAVTLDYPSDAKWRAFVVVVILAGTASFIGVRSEQADSIEVRISELGAAPLAPLGPLESIDPSRPVLLVPAQADNSTGLVFCVSVPREPGHPLVLASRSRRHDPPSMAFASFDELRDYAASRALLAAPQTSASDRIAVDLWGRDWRDE